VETQDTDHDTNMDGNAYKSNGGPHGYMDGYTNAGNGD
jgi:hypothetical protein